MAEWIQAMQGKLDYVETRKLDEADIICEWQEPEQRYEAYDGSSTAPRGRPRMERVGNTQICWNVDAHGKPYMVKAIVGIFACQGSSMRIIEDDLLRAKLMHEVAHGLGIRKHLPLREDCLYPQIDELFPKLELSWSDRQTMFDLYKEHPTNQAAVDKFIGMRAVSKHLNQSPQPSGDGS